MKTIAILLLFAAPVLAHATDIHPGDSLADVRAALGAPNGHAQVDNKLTLFYDRGQVELVDGKVVTSDLLSPGELAAKQAREEAGAAQAIQLRVAEGQALKAQKLADPAFISAPPAYQLSYWKDFRLLYPEVRCDRECQLALARQQDQVAKQAQEYELALVRQQEQLAAQEREQKLAELEARVSDAENRAALAENAARQVPCTAPISPPYYVVVVSRERFREHEHEDTDRHRFRRRAHEDNDGDCDDRGQRDHIDFHRP